METLLIRCAEYCGIVLNCHTPSRQAFSAILNCEVSGRLDLSQVLTELGKRGVGLLNGRTTSSTSKDDATMQHRYIVFGLFVFVSFCFPTSMCQCCVNVVSMLCQCCVKVSDFIRDEVLQLMVEGGAVLQGQMLKEGLCEARLPVRHMAWCSPCAPDL